MKFGNTTLRIFRRDDCIDDYGRRLKNCGHSIVGDIFCVHRARPSNFRNNIDGFLLRQKEFEIDREIMVFTYHNTDQPNHVEVKKDDYAAFYINNSYYYFKVKRITEHPIFNNSGDGCIKFKIMSERLEPRECPKDIVAQYNTDTLPIIE